MTPNQRHEMETKPAETKIAEVAEALAARWTAATVPVPFDAPAVEPAGGEGASPTPRATVCYRHAAALPTTAALSIDELTPL